MKSLRVEQPDSLRRSILVRSVQFVGAGLSLLLASGPARATPDAMQQEIDKVRNGRAIRDGRVSLDLPPLVENGNTVPMVVKVDSPMTDADHVRAIHVFNEKNPQPHVVSVQLSPRNGRAFLSTRVKLADTQRVIAIAEMSDGSLWSASADVIVTIAACTELF